ncbi:TRAP transporter substrate-binding protein [Propionivibrio sp.]|uniref:TRAP transporter substrate-binding protein n=1 Tax=Propionivibrio sp. TaxID=2212460 RepID=UPI0039E6C17B
MMKKSAWKHIVLAGALSLSGASGALAAVTARLGHAMPDTHPQAVAMNRFVELAAKYTNNNVQIKVYHSAQLGSDEKQLQAVQSGTQEFYIGSVAAFSTRIKEVQIWDMPFLFANNQEVYALQDGPTAQKIFKQMEPAGVIGLGWGNIGFRNISNSKRPITKVEDLSGLKIRVTPNPLAIDIWKTLGTNATPMAFSEVFTALEIKAIDGQENPLMHMYANKMQEVQKFISLSNHAYVTVGLVASKKFWDGLPDADKAGIQKAADEAKALQRQLLEQADKDVIAKFIEAGVKVNAIADEELLKFRERVKPVVERFSAQIGESFVKEFQAEIEKVRSGS